MSASASPSSLAPGGAGGAVQQRPAIQARVPAALILLGCAVTLGLAAWLKPDATGTGTHMQLGLPPCGMMTFAHLPCPTCGMTTAFTHAAHGRLLSALAAQPAGAVLAVATAAAGLLSLRALVTGRSLGLWGRWLGRPATLVGLGVFIGLAWIYKILAVQGILPW